MTLNYCTIITPKILFENIELIQATPYFNVYRYKRTKGVIFRLPKDLTIGVACHVFFEHEINLTNTLKTKTLTLKIQATFVPVSYGLFCGFEHLDGKDYWDDEDDYGCSQEYFKPDYKSDKNVKRVAGLPPKVPLNMIDYLKEILFEPITEAEMISKYAFSLGCQVNAMQDLMFIPEPVVNETGNGVTSRKLYAYQQTLNLFNTISSENMNLIPQKNGANV
jgi:hypothetical protein